MGVLVEQEFAQGKRQREQVAVIDGLAAVRQERVDVGGADVVVSVEVAVMVFLPQRSRVEQRKGCDAVEELGGGGNGAHFDVW